MSVLKTYHNGAWEQAYTMLDLPDDSIPTSKISGLADVATSGSYNDLTDKPTIDNNNQKIQGAGTGFGANDTVNIVAGSNVTVTPDTTNKKITIAATDTTYSDATTSTHGLMSSSDKTKLNGIATGATANTGTVTSVSVKINGAVKGTVTTSGTIDLGTVGGALKFQNISVPVSAWTANTIYDDYGFRAAIALSGVTASHFPEVVLGINEATSGAIAPICESYTGGVYVYASEKPDSTITIPSIVAL